MKAHPARLAGIDNLRFFVILLVVVLHGATKYLEFAPDSSFFSLLVTSLEAPLLPLLFFIAGYFSVFSLRLSGSVRYAGKKILFLGPAWIAGVLLLAPFSRYVEQVLFNPEALVTEGRPDLFQDLWYVQSVYWVFGALLLLYLVQAVLYRFPGFVRWFDRAPVENCERCRRRRVPELLALYLVMTAAYFLVLRAMPLHTWSSDRYFVLGQLTLVPLYVGYFIFGVIAGRGRYLHREWLRDEKAWPQLRFWIPLAVVTWLGYLVNRFVVPVASRYDTGVLIATAVILNAMVLSWLLSGIAIARCYLELLGSRWKRVSTNSAGVFFLHPLFLVLFIAGDRVVSRVPPILGFSAVIIATVSVSWLSTEGMRRLMRRFAGARR